MSSIAFSNRPALSAVVARLNAGVLPNAAEFANLLREVEFEPGRARSMTAQYAAALPSAVPAGEEGLMRSLRAFSIR